LGREWSFKAQRGSPRGSTTLASLMDRVSIVNVLSRLYRLGTLLYPERSFDNLKHRVKVIALGLLNWQVVRSWYAISDNPALTRALKRNPEIQGAIYWPYMHAQWSVEKRLRAIDQHYRLLAHRTAVLDRVISEPVLLADMGPVYNGMRLILDRAKWFCREGEVVLNIFLDDRRIYSIAFSLGLDGAQVVAYVGAIQGSNEQDALSIYRTLTRSCFGVRPRDLVVTSLQLLCEAMGIERLLAISGACHHHNGAYFGASHRDIVHVDYDKIWIEHGGHLGTNGFYEFSARFSERGRTEIPTRKRSQYRRRYEMLAHLAQNIQRTCSRCSASII